MIKGAEALLVQVIDSAQVALFAAGKAVLVFRLDARKAVVGDATKDIDENRDLHLFQGTDNGG